MTGNDWCKLILQATKTWVVEWGGAWVPTNEASNYVLHIYENTSLMTQPLKACQKDAYQGAFE